MKKYIGGFAFFFVLSVLVTSQHERYANDSAPPNSESWALASPKSPQARTSTQNFTWYERSWSLAYEILGWPAGITIWALFLTLAAIAEQTRETGKAANAAEKGIVLSQGPRIIVRNFYLKAPMARNSQVEGQFYIANHGGTEATVEEIFCEAEIMKEPLPMKRPYEGLIGRQEKRQVGVGASFDWPFMRKIPMTDYDVNALNEAYSSNFFFVYGWIGYRDQLGNYMRTNFCRKYVKTSNRFEPTNDPDYEDEYQRDRQRLI